MRRIANLLVRNWPLKLGAILLATVLYAGLVLGQNVRTWEGTLPVNGLRPPAGATLLSDLAPVTQIRYRAPIDVGVLSPNSFSATVDLSGVRAEPGGPSVVLPINVLALDQRVQVVDFQPREVEVRLDPVDEREMPVEVQILTVPESVTVGAAQFEPGTVTLRGASSRVNSVAAVIARVSIDASALNVDRDVLVVPIDANGNEVQNVEVEPARVRVRIPVAQELSTRTLPVVPQLVGAPPPGYRIVSVTVDPQVMTISGEASVVSQLQNVPTTPIDVAGRTSDLEAEVGVSLPEGATASESERVRVMLTIAEETGSQTFGVGIRLEGESADVDYAPSVRQVNVTFGGALSALQAVNGATLVAAADVRGLSPGTHVVPLTVEPLEGVEVVSVDPASVTIVVSAPEVVPTPAASP